MMKNSEWLDKKVGKFIGRVYMLALLFICNALIAVGATLRYILGKSSFLLVVGSIGTIICIGILSKPVNLENLNK